MIKDDSIHKRAQALLDEIITDEMKLSLKRSFEQFVVFGRTEIYLKPINMTDPQEVVVVEPKSTYEIPAYMVTNDGMQDAGTWRIEFCKGNKADEAVPRQVGVFTESLIAAAKKYLEENNVGDLATRETSMAITKLDEALLWIGKRAADRQRRGVQGTYQK